MSFGLLCMRITSQLYTLALAAQTTCRRCRRATFYPMMLRDGYDMVLLQNGTWIPSTTALPKDVTLARYDAELGHIIAPGDSVMRRWPWLAVVANTGDVSDFFNRLRVSQSLMETLSSGMLFMLYAFQCGRALTGSVAVTMRSGEDTLLENVESVLMTVKGRTVSKPPTPVGAKLPQSPQLRAIAPFSLDDSQKRAESLNYIR